VERNIWFILDAGVCVGGRVDACPKADSPSLDNQWTRGLHVETVQSALTVILKLVIGGLTSVILIVLGTINLQFQGWFVPISRGDSCQLGVRGVLIGPAQLCCRWLQIVVPGSASLHSTPQ